MVEVELNYNIGQVIIDGQPFRCDRISQVQPIVIHLLTVLSQKEHAEVKVIDQDFTKGLFP